MEDEMLNQLVILRAALTRTGELALDSHAGAAAFPMTTLRAATNVTAMVVGLCLVLLGMVALSMAV